MSIVVDRPRGLAPTIGGSTYVKPSEMDWKPTRFEKVSIKVLYEDPERGEMTCLLKLEPGAHIPFHKHLEIEQTLVLEGSVEDHDGVAGGRRLHLAQAGIATRKHLARRCGVVRSVPQTEPLLLLGGRNPRVPKALLPVRSKKFAGRYCINSFHGFPTGIAIDVVNLRTELLSHPRRTRP
jgi:hypothetical protein